MNVFSVALQRNFQRGMSCKSGMVLLRDGGSAILYSEVARTPGIYVLIQGSSKLVGGN